MDTTEIHVTNVRVPSKKRKAKPRVVLSKGSVSDNWKNFCSSMDRPVQTQPPQLEPRKKITNRTSLKPLKSSKVVALDCEMVADKNGQDMLGRVSLVDFNFNCIYDKYVKPTDEVLDYRTRFSGIRPLDIENGEEFSKVQQEVKQLLRNRILVGHSLRSDFNVLGFGHHIKLIRDTSIFPTFREVSDGKTPSLRKLAMHFLGEKIQEGEHSSVQDATATMKLYKMFRQSWEASLCVKSQ